MINKFQISIIFFVYLIYLSGPVIGGGSESECENGDPEAQRKACIEKSGVDPYKLDQETYEKLIQNSDHKLGCFMACALKAGGTMNKDGTINKKKVKEGSSEKEFQMIEGCLEEKGADECETAIKFVKCSSE